MSSATTAITVLALSALLGAQDQQSTLSRMIDAGAAVARVQVLKVTVDGGITNVEFRTRAQLEGAVPERFALQEPARRACGQALHGLIARGAYLAFLDLSDGPPRLCSGTARALVPLDPEVLAHVQRLLRDADDAARVATLTTALSSHSVRVRQDAALSLPRTRALAAASPADRERILDALRRTLPAEPYNAVGLLAAAEHLRMAEAVDVLLPHYLAHGDSPLGTVVLAAIPRLGAGRAIARIREDLPVSRGALGRAVTLLEQIPDRGAAQVLAVIGKDPRPQVAARARAALAGQSATLPRFRSIRPGRPER